ncbi:MAG: ABC transporter permease [Thermomicrobiales bacterium]|nr:ABC transporter permease [Thermomicrobiales bacterium]
MIRYAARRLLQVVFVLFGVSIVVFLMLRLIPGDVVDLILGSEGTASPQQLAELRKLFGLDQPLYTQYLSWLGSLLQGDLGNSIRTGRPILPDLLDRLPLTVQLTSLAMFFSIIVAIPLGVMSSVMRNSKFDGVLRVGGLLGLSIPNFWIATMLILLVSRYGNGIFPTSGYVPLGRDPVASYKSLFLPALALAAPNVAILMRMTRSSMLEVLRHEYVVTARSKGLRNSAVILRHVLRNALIPVVTIAGVQVGYLLGGAIVIEQVFALPGVGTLILNGISHRDYPMVQAGTLLVAALFVMVNLVVDLLYSFLDPRIRYE